MELLDCKHFFILLAAELHVNGGVVFEWTTLLLSHDCCDLVDSTGALSYTLVSESCVETIVVFRVGQAGGLLFIPPVSNAPVLIKRCRVRVVKTDKRNFSYFACLAAKRDMLGAHLVLFALGLCHAKVGDRGYFTD